MSLAIVVLLHSKHKIGNVQFVPFGILQIHTAVQQQHSLVAWGGGGFLVAYIFNSLVNSQNYTLPVTQMELYDTQQ